MKPRREHATNNSQTYMVTSPTWERRSLFQTDAWARLLIDTLYHYRGAAYLLHEFVVMPDHFHALITPQTSLEKAVQFIKGGFSYRAKKELGSSMEVWQKGFQDHRIRDASDLAAHIIYIHDNPVKEHLCERPEEFPYSSAHAGFDLDAVPQGQKPQVLGELFAARLQAHRKTVQRLSKDDGGMQAVRALLLVIIVATAMRPARLFANTCVEGKPARISGAFCGRVIDPTGAPVPSVGLRVLDQLGNAVADTQADPKGDFIFPQLAKGNYRLTTTTKGWNITFGSFKMRSAKATSCVHPASVELGISSCEGGISNRRPPHY
jgi:putative transposase